MPNSFDSYPPDSHVVQEEVVSGDGLSLAQAARQLPGARGRPCSPSSLFRWGSEGIAMPDGRRVYLEMCRCGCRLYTSRGALRRFIASQNARPGAQPQPAGASVRREREIAQAEAELRAAGV